MRYKWRFRVTESEWSCEPNKGKTCYLANADGKKEGQGCGFDTREEAEEYLYRLQDQKQLADKEILWEGIEPRRTMKAEQMELF